MANWSLEKLGTEDLWRWHAYDYGWRRVMLGDQRRISTLDPEGRWFDAALAADAEEMFQALKPGLGPRVPTARVIEARELREKWARDHGCEDFAQVMAIGIQNVARSRRPAAAAMGSWQQPARATDRPPLYQSQLEEPPPHPGEYAEAAEP